MFKKTAIVTALLLATGAANAAQIAYGTASSTTGNNFTMLDPSGSLVGGATDVAMTWDGTVFTNSADYTGVGTASNMTLASSQKFFFNLWTAHDVQVFGQGSYAFDTTLGGGNNEVGTLNLNVGAGQLGAHMLFDWNGNLNIDVAVLWDANGAFAGDQTLSGAGIWNSVSVDGNGNGIPGIPMAGGGPFGGFNANFNLNGITPSAVPVPAAVWLFGSGLLGLAGVARRKKVA